MNPAVPLSHLNRITTPWTLVRNAHDAGEDHAVQAQRMLLQRYCGAVYRYLGGALRDEDTALDLLQEFVLRFLRGDFKRANPASGRFRDYLKTALSHLVTDHYRARRSLPRPLPDNFEHWATAPDPSSEPDDAFLLSWRTELIERTWQSLAAANPTYYSVLVEHVENPIQTSASAAEQLTAHLGRTFTASSLRVTLQRAREKFADLLLDEVALSLGTCTPAELDAELQALRLLKLCSPAIEKRNHVHLIERSPGGAGG